MTGLDRIVGEIEAESKKSVESVLAQAREKADEITAEAEKQIAAEEKEIDAHAQAEAASIQKQAEDGADIIKRRGLLSAKQEIIAQTLEAAKQKLYGLSDSEYADFLGKLVIKNADDGKAQIIFGTEDVSRIPSGFVSQIDRELPEGKSIEQGTDRADFAHGFILSYEGAAENVSIDELFLAKKDELTDIIKDTLFD